LKLQFEDVLHQDEDGRGATLHQKVVVIGVGDIWRARGARAYNGGLGAEPQRGPGAEPLVEG